MGEPAAHTQGEPAAENEENDQTHEEFSQVGKGDEWLDTGWGMYEEVKRDDMWCEQTEDQLQNKSGDAVEGTKDSAREILNDTDTNGETWTDAEAHAEASHSPFADSAELPDEADPTEIVSAFAGTEEVLDEALRSEID